MPGAPIIDALRDRGFLGCKDTFEDNPATHPFIAEEASRGPRRHQHRSVTGGATGVPGIGAKIRPLPKCPHLYTISVKPGFCFNLPERDLWAVSDANLVERTLSVRVTGCSSFEWRVIRPRGFTF